MSIIEYDFSKTFLRNCKQICDIMLSIDDHLREDINEKKRFLSGIARMRGGVYLCPDFLAPFFCQVTVLKMAIFYSNFTVIVCFLVIFVIIIIKITKIIIIIIIETIIIIIKKNFGHTRKTSFLTSKKEDQVARIGVRGGV